MLELVAGAALGSLGTVIVTWWINRNTASRAARRETYLELLSMLKAALRVQQTATFDHEQRMPDIVSDENIDAFNARLELDASADVRRITMKCFRLVQRFNVSHSMRVPIDVDEHGLYVHRFDQMRDVDDELAQLRMRMSLGTIHDELVSVVDELAARIRREVHGGRS